MRSSWILLGLSGLATAACPYMDSSPDLKARDDVTDIHQRQEAAYESNSDFLKQFTVDDRDSFLTSDVGGPIQDNNSLKAGERGPTLLEDFIFRQKITHFDHERVRISGFEFSFGGLADY
jgi:catalase